MSDLTAPHAAPHAALDPRLLEVLVCPLTRTPLVYDRARGELISKAARLAYPVRDGVPVMLPEEARPLAEGE
jgi:uncharacterized protein YbaR (Trm112 family)